MQSLFESAANTTADMGDLVNATLDVGSTIAISPGVSRVRLLAFICSTVAVAITVVGNVIVILAFVIEKKLWLVF